MTVQLTTQSDEAIMRRIELLAEAMLDAYDWEELGHLFVHGFIGIMNLTEEQLEQLERQYEKQIDEILATNGKYEGEPGDETEDETNDNEPLHRQSQLNFLPEVGALNSVDTYFDKQGDLMDDVEFQKWLQTHAEAEEDYDSLARPKCPVAHRD